jgi:hypothetical protein
VRRELLSPEVAQRFEGMLTAWVGASSYLGKVAETDSQHEAIEEQENLVVGLKEADRALQAFHTLEHLVKDGIPGPDDSGDLASRIKSLLSAETITNGVPKNFLMLMRSCERLGDAGRVVRLAVEVTEGKDCDDAKASLKPMARGLPALVDANAPDFEGYVALGNRLADELRKVSMALDSALAHVSSETGGGAASKNLRKLADCLEYHVEARYVLVQGSGELLGSQRFVELSDGLDKMLGDVTSGVAEPAAHAAVMHDIDDYRSRLSAMEQE